MQNTYKMHHPIKRVKKMKLFLPLILILCFQVSAQNENCLQFGQSLSAKIDSACFSGWSNSAKPMITIIDYGTLSKRTDTVKPSGLGGSLRIYKLNDEILKLDYKGATVNEGANEIEQEHIQIFFDKNNPIYSDYRFEMTVNGKKVCELNLFLCLTELNTTNKTTNIEPIIEHISQLIEDARN